MRSVHASRLPAGKYNGKHTVNALYLLVYASMSGLDHSSVCNERIADTIIALQ
jgi:hypothetical protein